MTEGARLRAPFFNCFPVLPSDPPSSRSGSGFSDGRMDEIRHSANLHSALSSHAEGVTI